ncbi:hypothetical protein P8452_20622 [Trifolium repens]|nr:hypothetical protein P8452_20622 [Trifolium repens]
MERRLKAENDAWVQAEVASQLQSCLDHSAMSARILNNKNLLEGNNTRHHDLTATATATAREATRSTTTSYHSPVPTSSITTCLKEDKIGAVPLGLSTDSDVFKRH